MARSAPPLVASFEDDDAFAADIGGPIAGVDEAGRGAWCGPVVAAAAILPRDTVPDGLADSKTLTEKRREALFAALSPIAILGVGAASAEEIDAIGIAPATMLAMKRAVAALPAPPAGALIDGLFAPNLGPIETRTLVKGDARSLSVAAASIVAKVTRDRLLRELDTAFPGYGWASNKGYGAKAHALGLDALGVTPHHRKSYAPVAARLQPQN
ncbi:MAG: ribonuclease HII [Parvularcula sp.]